MQRDHRKRKDAYSIIGAKDSLAIFVEYLWGQTPKARNDRRESLARADTEGKVRPRESLA